MSGRAATLSGLTEQTGCLLPSFTLLSDTEFRWWPSSKQELTCPAHLPDPYEAQMVEVCTSSLPGSGQGLRAKRDVPAGTLVSYYHGLRMPASEQNPFGPPTGYAIYVEVIATNVFCAYVDCFWQWEMKKQKLGDVLDLTRELQSVQNYSSTLAHKVNHSFKANCDWVHAEHPCYAKIPVSRLNSKVRSLLNMDYATILQQNFRGTFSHPHVISQNWQMTDSILGHLYAGGCEGRARIVHPLRI